MNAEDLKFMRITAEYSEDCGAVMKVDPTAILCLINKISATERERDELRERLSLVREQRDTELNKNTQLEAEITRRDAAAGEPVAWVCGDEEIRDFKAGREVTIVRDCDDSDLEYLPLYTARPPAVLPPECQAVPASLDSDLSDAEKNACISGANEMRGQCLALGAQQQKVVELPEEFYTDHIVVGKPSSAMCSDKVKKALDAADVKWEVKK